MKRLFGLCLVTVVALAMAGTAFATTTDQVSWSLTGVSNGGYVELGQLPTQFTLGNQVGSFAPGSTVTGGTLTLTLNNTYDGSSTLDTWFTNPSLSGKAAVNGSLVAGTWWNGTDTYTYTIGGSGGSNFALNAEDWATATSYTLDSQFLDCHGTLTSAVLTMKYTPGHSTPEPGTLLLLGPVLLGLVVFRKLGQA